LIKATYQKIGSATVGSIQA